MDDASGIYAASETGLAIAVQGLVYRTDMVVHILLADGRYRYDWPDQGLTGDSRHDEQKNPSFWGRWHRDGDRITVERPQGAIAFRYMQDSIIGEDGKPFLRLPDRQADLRLIGTWTREASASDRPRITFSSGERFATSGGLLGLIAMPDLVADWGPYPPDSLFQWPDGGGRWTLDGYTLTLQRDDGAGLNMLALAASANRLRLGYTWFNRSAG
ncbi:hypothetical protein M0208_18235 [Sphingomonas sp. SUN019]|uniref:hypothetical protein n=1 Tax=Sphingomonas sp. SUN019 TaxID=2937788 RepID=UPI002164A11F|nr:hypothetical protein [Sphingomonas sp. SUN019]UVO52352.1 hypothetical protein M0208_18235 [Sphingomonas sp. SUN019]